MKKHGASLKQGKRHRGVMMVYMAFLLFSSLLMFSYMVAHIAVMENDIYAVTLSVARVRNQFDAIEYHFLRLPTTDLNYTVNGSSVILMENLPFPVTNESSIGFIAFKKFVENYSLINTTFDAVPELPGELRIKPHRFSVIHPDEYSVVMQPVDNTSAGALVNYSFSLFIQGSTPSVAWVEVHEVPANSSDALHVYAIGVGSGEPGRINNVSTYINKSRYCRLEYKRGANLIMGIDFNRGTEGKAELDLDPRFGVTLNSTITFDSPITETVGGLKPANVTVTVPNVLKRVQIVR